MYEDWFFSLYFYLSSNNNYYFKSLNIFTRWQEANFKKYTPPPLNFQQNANRKMGKISTLGPNKS